MGGMYLKSRSSYLTKQIPETNHAISGQIVTDGENEWGLFCLSPLFCVPCYHLAKEIQSIIRYHLFNSLYDENLGWCTIQPQLSTIQVPGFELEYYYLCGLLLDTTLLLVENPIGNIGLIDGSMPMSWLYCFLMLRT